MSTYLVTVMFSAQITIVAISIRSTELGRRIPGNLTIHYAFDVPTIDEIDALVGPATPHFAYQIRARIRELVLDLPDGNPVRRYGEEKMELLDRLGHASSLAEDGERERLTRIGWETIPSSAPAYDPLPKRE